MAKLTQKEIQNNLLKQAYDGEVLRQAKYSYLMDIIKDKRLKKLFKVFAMTARGHIAELKQEMQNLDIK
ncbi:hypothetical protein [Desulforamulus reducens]|uniref:hypothetical protein n=1 Tax=Desulforamulus reducens TaxID=59610 RepID=UPI00031E9977|nr:hypothetical protein [Desulforamulus reducens]